MREKKFLTSKMQKALSFILISLLFASIYVIQTNSNAINSCKIGGTQCSFDDECCSLSCHIPEDGLIGNCLSNLDEIKCSRKGVDCTVANVTCCNQCRVNWSGVFCT